MENENVSVNVLVVDDEAANLKLVTRVLEEHSFTVFNAEDAKSAVELINKEHIHIVITDKNMPGLGENGEGGMELLRYIRQNKPEIQVMVVTGFATLETAIEAMKLGAFDYITKPFSVIGLVAKVERVVEYLRFINPKKMIDNYKEIQGEALSLIAGQSSSADAMHQHGLIEAFNQKLDILFNQIMKQESFLLEQRDTLAAIAGWTEQALESIDSSSPEYALVEKALKSANKRI